MQEAIETCNQAIELFSKNAKFRSLKEKITEEIESLNKGIADEVTAREAMRLAQHKLSVKTKFVLREKEVEVESDED